MSSYYDTEDASEDDSDDRVYRERPHIYRRRVHTPSPEQSDADADNRPPRAWYRIQSGSPSPPPVRHFEHRPPPPPPPRPFYYQDLPSHVRDPRRRPHDFHEYIPPIDDDGNSLSFDINLISPVKDDVRPGWSTRRTELASQLPESLSLEASRGFTDESETEKIILTLNSQTGSNASANLRWIHLQQEHMSIQSLEDLVTQTPGLNNDDLLIALRLLHQVAERSEARYVHGQYLKPTVLRGDCHSTGQSDRHATFMNFPYFAFQAPSVPGQQDARLHPSKGLLQTVHLLESTKSRDAEQAICKLGRSNRFGKFIHVPQVWSIAIGSDVLITYSTVSQSTMRGETIEIQQPLAREKSGPSVLRITDPYQRTFFFSLELCKTWFELEELVYTQCDLEPMDDARDIFDIALKDKTPLTGAQWPAIIASTESPFIDILIYIRERDESDESGVEDDTYLVNTERSTRITLLHRAPRERRWTVERHRRNSEERSRRRTQSGRASQDDDAERRRHTQERYMEDEQLPYSRSSTVDKENPSTRIVHDIRPIGGSTDAGRRKNSKRRSSQPEKPEEENRRVVEATSSDSEDNALRLVRDIPSVTGSPDAGEQKAHERRSSQPDKQEEGNKRHVQATSSDHEDSPQTAVVAIQRRLTGREASNVTFAIEELGGKQNIVAEPESYYSDPEPEHGQGNDSDRGQRRQHTRQARARKIVPSSRPIQRRSHTRSTMTSLSRSIRYGNSPPSRRPTTYSGYFEYANTELSPGPVVTATRRRRTADFGPEEVVIERPSRFSRYHSHFRDDFSSLHGPYARSVHYASGHSRPASLRSYFRSRRDLSSVRGHAAHYTPEAASTNSAEIDPNIYYIPKRKKEPVPVVNISDEAQAAEAEEFAPERKPSERSFERHNPKSFRTDSLTFDKPFTNFQKERRSGSSSSSRPVPPTKVSVLPILMWPTDPPGKSTEGPQHPLNGTKGPPRAGIPGSNINQDQASESRLAEVLERVHNSLLADKSSNHNLIFREMEIAHRKDTIYKLPEQNNLASENDNDAGKPQDGMQGGKSKYNPTEGFLNATSTNDSTGDQLQVPEYQSKLLQLSTVSNSLLECFVPADYSSPITWRYYGSIKRIIETVDQAQKHNNISRLYTNQGTVWLIVDIAESEYLEKHHLQPLSKPLKSCSKCGEKFSYKNDIDASDHLLQDHFPSDKQPTRATAMLWVKKFEPLQDRRRCEEHMDILRPLCTRLSEKLESVQEILDGVCATGAAHDPRYRLPKALVVAFRKLILLLVCASGTLRYITETENWGVPDWTIFDDGILYNGIKKISALSNGVDRAVEQGKFDLTMMLRAQDYTESIKRYEAVGPYYILIMALSNVQFGVECGDLVEVYTEYIGRLSFQVSQYPRRRLLRSLKYVEEELLALHRIMEEQHDQYTHLCRVLIPESFRTPPETGISLYTLELALINKRCFQSAQRLGALEQLVRRVNRLTDDTKTSVEINDDDHGKAILVFTIVTLVFLPLSFVASFLGMNTADIRNQTANQTLYWIIALPVTAGVVIIALVIGYKYEVMRDYIERYMAKSKRE